MIFFHFPVGTHGSKLCVNHLLMRCESYVRTMCWHSQTPSWISALDKLLGELGIYATWLRGLFKYECKWLHNFLHI